MLELVIVATGTALATGLGAVPVFLLGARAEKLRPVLLGIAAGVMGVAAIAGLLKPALDDSTIGTVAAGLIVGVAFLLIVRRFLLPDRAETVTRAKRTSLLVFAVLFVHSLPEGLALGTAWASTVEGLSTFIVIAIAIQNVPEGTSVAIPMEAAGYGAARQFWAAVATSAPQPIAAPIAYLAVDEVSSLLPLSFAFAAGAMLALVAVEVLPDALRGGRVGALAGTGVGAAAMLALSAALGV
jgi:zinc transporter, ZIP family